MDDKAQADIGLVITWIFGAVLLFIIGVSFFLTQEAYSLPIEGVRDIMDDSYIAGDIEYDVTNLANKVQWVWSFAHVILGVGILVWLFWRSSRKEQHTYYE